MTKWRNLKEAVGALPAGRWLFDYTREQLQGDVTAGATVGVMLIPQAMAYALLAGVPAVYGLYASLVPLLLYPMLGTAPRLAVGIVALDMLAVGAGLAALGPASPAQAASWAMTVAMMVGVIHLVLATLRLELVFRLMSRPVIAGFMVAAPLLIGLSQLSTLLGVSIERTDHILVNTWRTLELAQEANLQELALGLSAMVLLVAMRVAWKTFPRALALVLMSGALVWAVAPEVAVVGALDGELPGFALPDLSPGLMRDLLPTAATVVLLQIISVASLGKSLGSAEDGPAPEPTSELRALGAMNVLGSMFGSVPVSASFSRTAVNASAGAQTPMANAVSAILVATSILLLSSSFAFVPKSSLAAIILVASFGSVDFEETRALFALERSEGWLALLTTAATLIIGIQEGVLIGVAASVLHLLHRLSRPDVVALGKNPGDEIEDNPFRSVEENDDVNAIEGVLILRIDGSLSFTNVARVRALVLERLDDRGVEAISTVILDGRGINVVDSTALSELSDLLDELEEQEVEIHFVALKARVREAFCRAGLDERLDPVEMRQSPERVLAEVLASDDEDAPPPPPGESDAEPMEP